MVTDLVANMESDMIADMVANMMADMEVNMVADIKVDKMADMKVVLWLICRLPTWCPTLHIEVDITVFMAFPVNSQKMAKSPKVLGASI